jgi:DNA-binding GntR family transcriptional regulator
MIDGLAARLAARRASDDLIARLRAILVRQRAALSPWDAAAYTASNVEFHTAIISEARNEFLSAQQPIVYMTSQIFTPVERTSHSRAESAAAEHEAIVAAIAAADENAAERVARRHIRTTIALLLRDAGR